MGGRVDAVTFTSSAAVRSFAALADDLGVGADLRDILSSRVLAACVGPITGEMAETVGFVHRCVPERPARPVGARAVHRAPRPPPPPAHRRPRWSCTVPRWSEGARPAHGPRPAPVRRVRCRPAGRRRVAVRSASGSGASSAASRPSTRRCRACGVLQPVGLTIDTVHRRGWALGATAAPAPPWPIRSTPWSADPRAAQATAGERSGAGRAAPPVRGPPRSRGDGGDVAAEHGSAHPVDRLDQPLAGVADGLPGADDARDGRLDVLLGHAPDGLGEAAGGQVGPHQQRVADAGHAVDADLAAGQADVGRLVLGAAVGAPADVRAAAAAGQRGAGGDADAGDRGGADGERRPPSPCRPARRETCRPPPGPARRRRGPRSARRPAPPARPGAARSGCGWCRDGRRRRAPGRPARSSSPVRSPSGTFTVTRARPGVLRRTPWPPPSGRCARISASRAPSGTSTGSGTKAGAAASRANRSRRGAERIGAVRLDDELHAALLGVVQVAQVDEGLGERQGGRQDVAAGDEVGQRHADERRRPRLPPAHSR